MITSTKPAPNCLKILSALTFVLHCTTKQWVQIISEGAFIKGALMSESFYFGSNIQKQSPKHSSSEHYLPKNKMLKSDLLARE